MLFFIALASSSCTNSAINSSPTEYKNVVNYLVSNPDETQKILDSLASHQERQDAEKTKISIDEIRGQLATLKYNTIIGVKDAKLKIITFSDYNCAFCRKSAEFLQKYNYIMSGDVSVIVKELPIRSGDSVRAARYALAAAKLGRYGDFHSALMQAEKADAKQIADVISRLGIDPKQMDQIASSSEVSEELAANAKLAQDLGIKGTPAFIVGSRLQRGWNEQIFDATVKSEINSTLRK